ncbi:MAG: histidine ammonia-lyase [Candidatus Heimdallarchaeota archaeon]
MESVVINGESLSLEEIIAVARRGAHVNLTPRVKEQVEQGRKVVQEILESGKVVYGINTGFGELARVKIPTNETGILQENMILSHSAGVGPPLDPEIVKATMLLQVNSIAKGHTGARIVICQTLMDMLNNGVVPIVPAKGSIGASGDLAPLAHIVSVMLGHGGARVDDGACVNGKTAMDRVKIPIIRLEAMEGLALINGTHMMTAIGSLALYDVENLVKAAEIASMMSLEALKGTDTAFEERIHALRPHPGQLACAENLRKLTQASENLQSHKEYVPDAHEIIQDSYSLRCIPQVHGAIRDAISYVKRVIKTELNSVTCNPLIFPESSVKVSLGGNFHGQPVALALDVLGITITELGNISERRINRLLDAHLSNGLPPFLTEKAGTHSGYMLAQYIAAALVSENKVLATPASVDSIPVSANTEDYVCMGMHAAMKARTIIENTMCIIAIELLCAAQALDFRAPLRFGRGTQKAYEVIRHEISHLEEDRETYRDIKKLVEMIRSGTIVRLVEDIVGQLN